MKPYSGPDAWVYVTSGMLLALFIIVVIVSFALGKKELTSSLPEDVKKWRKLKFLSFFAYVIILITTVGVFYGGSAASRQNYRPSMVDYIQSFDVKVVDGIRITDPLAPHSMAKFIVESKNGLVRCHAVSHNVSDDVVFTCYDNISKNFAIPLKDINHSPSDVPVAKSSHPKSSKSSAKATTTPSAAK